MFCWVITRTYQTPVLIWLGTLPKLTRRGDQTKYPNGLACAGSYQSLPRSLLAVRNRLVLLAWWWGQLPILTNTPIWLNPTHAAPLPMLTTWPGLSTHMNTFYRQLIFWAIVIFISAWLGLNVL